MPNIYHLSKIMFSYVIIHKVLRSWSWSMNTKRLGLRPVRLFRSWTWWFCSINSYFKRAEPQSLDPKFILVKYWSDWDHYNFFQSWFFLNVWPNGYLVLSLYFRHLDLCELHECESSDTCPRCLHRIQGDRSDCHHHRWYGPTVPRYVGRRCGRCYIICQINKSLHSVTEPKQNLRVILRTVWSEQRKMD